MMVEFGYVIDLEGLIQIILDFLLKVGRLIIISIISGLIGGRIRKELMKKDQIENLDTK